MLNLLRSKQFRSFIVAAMPLFIGLLFMSIPAISNSDSARIFAQDSQSQETQGQPAPQGPQTQEAPGDGPSVIGVPNTNYSDSSYSSGGNTEGTVRVNNLANLEAVLNICANFLEIWGISNVGSFFFGAIVAFVLKRPVLGAILIVMCPVSAIGGLAAPGIINWLVASARDAQMDSVVGVTAVVTALFTIILTMGVGFIPAIIAARTNSMYKWPIFGLTFVSWLVPFGWPALLFWALRKNVQQAADADAQQI